MEQFSNIGTAVLNNGSTLTSVATTTIVTSEVNIPSTGTFRILIDNEILKVTAVSGTTWTVVRGDGSSTAASHTDGTTAYVIVTKEALDALVSIQMAGSEISNRRIINILGGLVVDNSGNGSADITVTPPALGYNAGIIVSSNSGAFDCSSGSWFTRTLSGINGTLSLSNVIANQEITIELVQDGTGGRAVTWFTTITWLSPTGTAPTIDAGPGGITVLRFKQTSSGNYLGWFVTSTLSYASTILGTSGLKAYYKLNETSGTTATDSSSNSNNGTYTNSSGYVFAQPGFSTLGQSVQLKSASTGYISCPTITLGSVSVEIWAMWLTASQSAMFVEQDNVNATWAFLLDGGNIAWRGGSSGDAVSIAPPLLGVWHHIVATQTSTTVFLYLDGAQVATTTGATALGGSGSAINIGRYGSSGGGFYYNGYIQHVSIYNTALSAATVKQHFNAATLTPGQW